MSCSLGSMSNITKPEAEILKKAGLSLSQEAISRLAIYEKLLTGWNERMNLTAISEPSAIWEKHFLDSILPLGMVTLPEGAAVADIGTGAGFPGVPMWIYRTDLNFTLVDSLKKRLNFLKELTDSIAMQTELVHSRAEDFGRTQYRESFDVVVSRAVATMPILCEYCLPLVRCGGFMLALKGREYRSELEQAEDSIKQLGASVEDIREYSLPSGDKRSIIAIRKNFVTPKEFPRPFASLKKLFLQ